MWSSAAASRLISTTLMFVTAIAAAAAVTAPASHSQGDALEAVRHQIGSARNWVEQAKTAALAEVAGALGDCGKLYGEAEWMLEPLLGRGNISYSRDDAITWLSAALANHRSCVDGLAESGLTITAPDLTSSFAKALASYANPSAASTPSKAVSTGDQNSSIFENGGVLLTSWTATTSKADMVVAKDGSGTHRSIEEAVAAAAAARAGRHKHRLVIYVKAGVYEERVEIPRHLRNLMMVGDGIDRTIVTGSRNVPDGSTTYNSATFGEYVF
ncbi:unnamed protein product [Linum tenue]|uniref:Pectinesterase n=1 Tax=Linum tenue TaxID=586396 RepID=A0AAV0HD70_9ROSI|nr:unnamed protein product [Linum tenue]